MTAIIGAVAVLIMVDIGIITHIILSIHIIK
jgi:hypothetical protein